MNFPSLPDLVIEPLVRAALEEDLGRTGDITTNAIVPPGHKGRAMLVARQTGVVAGLDAARLAFQALDPDIRFQAEKNDGDDVRQHDVIALVEGSMRGILTAERTALNFLCRLSGIATATRALVDAVKPHKARISCTRKTTPGLRALEKYAVRAGGGSNHRFGLYDAVLIKDNHVAAAGGVRPAVEKARAAVGRNVKVELEVDTLDQLREALDLPIDAVLLDNMDTSTLTEAVKLVNGRFETEASGHVTAANVAAIAATSVDVISSGWLTHSAPALDIALDYEER
ncbi:MAG: carboxylating nicotinate-nucleotide diphosphorylase [Alphaproteobacteria bacterium]|nr:carboxylating nicotinate-nucleotide diphosphorylase [Alphaproteobacteria bacterium]